MSAIYCLGMVVMGIVFYTDYRYGKIHNLVVLVILGIAIYQNPSFAMVYDILIVFIVLLPFWLSGGMGGGDYKLLIALGALMGWINCFLVFIIGGIAYLLFTFVKLYLQNQSEFRSWVSNMVFNIRLSVIGDLKMAAQLSQGKSVPFGCWLAVGYLVWTLLLFYV